MIDDLAILREILRRELETINTYEEMTRSLEDLQLRQIVAHITDEEREHVAEIYQLILERDERQRQSMARSEQHLQQIAAPERPTLSVGGDLPAGAPASPLENRDLAQPPPLVFADGAWSVGPLKRPR